MLRNGEITEYGDKCVFVLCKMRVDFNRGNIKASFWRDKMAVVMR
jgi:hypothetical protein